MRAFTIELDTIDHLHFIFIIINIYIIVLFQLQKECGLFNIAIKPMYKADKHCDIHINFDQFFIINSTNNNQLYERHCNFLSYDLLN